MDDLSLRIAALSPEKRLLLSQHLQKAPSEQTAGNPEPPSISHNGQKPEIDRSPHKTTFDRNASQAIRFSIFFFSCDEAHASEDKYALVRRSALYADQNGFYGVWIPERHGHPFGGLYPSPAVLAAALAMVTRQIRICAGSVVMPLHHPIQVAEEWAMIDQLSNGRAGVSFASGWHQDDFVLSPDNYERRKAIMFEGIDSIQRLWAGEKLPFRNGSGNDVPTEVYPKPIQKNIPIWVTSATSMDTWLQAAKIGANILTAFLGQKVEDLQEKIARYRLALEEHGHDPAAGQVTVMIHTFVGADMESVRQTVKAPFMEYLRTHLTLQARNASSQGVAVDATSFTESDRDALANHAYERYFHSSALFGTPETCLNLVGRLSEIGVNEVGCLIDFGIDTETVLSGLTELNTLRLNWERVQQKPQELNHKETVVGYADLVS